MTTLRFHNTLTRRKEDFSPFDPANVRVYACGPTVYDNLHIGNGRMLIVFDVLFRLLRHVYGEAHVTYVRNITDVDDKINARAAERGIPIRALTDEMIAIFHADAQALGCLKPTLEPRATDHIAPMIEIMQRLITNGHAYAADGHVLFDVPSMPDYGRLANKSMDEQIAGARVEVAPYKRGPTDFVLWKPSASNEPGWGSPWGRGRPGWHLECSAMSWQHLGETFDIHGGGIDLVFPHHENEIAQSRCAFGHGIMAQVWMHNGHLQVEGEKMSKSLGNFVTIRDLWDSERFGGRRWSGDVLRLAMLRTHYRQPIDFTVKALEEAARTLADFCRAVAGIAPSAPSAGFLEAMADDLNTPKALAELFALRGSDPAALAASLALLGITAKSPVEAEATALAPEMEALLARRQQARAAKDWKESDRLRDALVSLGIAIKDNKNGTVTWEHISAKPASRPMLTVEAGKVKPREKRKSTNEGDRLGQWTLGKKIGSGGNGDVWEASSKNIASAVVKILRNIDEISYKRFKSEVDILSRNENIPGIIPLIDFDLPEDAKKSKSWYAMPRASELKDFFANKKPIEIVEEFLKLAETLHILHDMSISHRDIKPSNILALNGRLCLSDFGLVKYPDREQLTPLKRDVGPKFTMAPEMRRYASSADGLPADVFSFAKTLWIALTGREFGFDGQYNSLSDIGLDNFLKDLYLAKINDYLASATSNSPQSRPTILASKVMLEEWCQINRDFHKRNTEEWRGFIRSIFPLVSPQRVEWTSLDSIVWVLNALGQVRGLNHMFYPTGGGNTITRVSRAGESGFIAIEALGLSILKPLKLTFESFDADESWNYFRLEADKVDNTGLDEYTKEGYLEYLTEVAPGDYRSRDVWDREDDPDGELTDFARPVTRYLKGAFVIFSTRSAYNLDSSTYDGRHERMTEPQFRAYIQRNASSKS